MKKLIIIFCLFNTLFAIGKYELKPVINISSIELYRSDRVHAYIDSRAFVAAGIGIVYQKDSTLLKMMSKNILDKAYINGFSLYMLFPTNQDIKIGGSINMFKNYFCIGPVFDLGYSTVPKWYYRFTVLIISGKSLF